ncbi:Mov34/MPN/PAD-1 family protein [Sporobolomyces koalae]|uniref:Mov34/MPN/PAD-1 family protein n=1 Tax=Sporobolomyces koalae TaxID=500713 RepID=UPI0031735D9B
MNSETAAHKSFELSNDIQAVDAVFRYNKQEQQDLLKQKPWRTDPHHFKKVRISAVALIKMVMHARSGGQYEIMGLMQGKLDGDTFVVMDAFALPVVGTETRVNAANEANEFMIQYIESSPAIGRPENIVGWYHSHPGYGCWLSGIDVMTQKTNQQFQDPFLAVVIDPNRTVSAGRVEIGAFRTYPDNYTPPNASSSSYQSIPLDKIEDFGVHSSSYYPLEISHFKSSRDEALLELLWNKYWTLTLSQSPLISNRAYQTSQLNDMVSKLSRAAPSAQHRCGISALSPLIVQARQALLDKTDLADKGKGKARDEGTGGEGPSRKIEIEESPLAKVVRDSNKYASSSSHGLITALVKDALFNDSTFSGDGGDSTISRDFQLPPVAS